MVDLDTPFDEVVIINKGLYEGMISNSFRTSNITITDDCLDIQVSMVGCNGDSWQYKLVDSEAIAESLPEQRNLKFEVTSNEDCFAFIRRNVTFNLENLQIEGSESIILNIEGFDEPITYFY